MVRIAFMYKIVKYLKQHGFALELCSELLYMIYEIQCYYQ